MRRASLPVLFLLAAPPAAAQQPLRLDTLQVLGSRVAAEWSAAMRSIDVVTREEIDRVPAATVNEVIARALGVDLLARSPAQADVAIRGASFEQVLVMIDGVSVNDDQTGHFHLDLAMPLDAIERVEILRGGASALYGSSAVGGIINIVTRSRVRAVEARVQAGSFASWTTAVAGGIGPVSAAVEHAASDGHRAGTDYRISQGRLRGDIALAGGHLRGSLAHAQRDFGAHHFYAPYDSYEETRTTTANIGWERGLGGWRLEPAVQLRRHADDFVLIRSDPGVYRNVHTEWQGGGELVARYARARGPRLALGGEAYQATLESNNLGDREEQRLAAYGELAIGDMAHATVTGGLRADHHSAFGGFLSPSLTAGIRLAPAFRLRGSVARGFRAPTWTERYYEDPGNIGDPDLDAERFWSYELGARATLGAVTALDAVAFVRRADDMIDWGKPTGSAPDTPNQVMNLEEATFRGLEVRADTRWRALELGAHVAALSFTSDSNGFDSRYALRPVQDEVGVRIGVPLPLGFRTHLSVSRLRRARETPYTLVDARVGWDRGPLAVFADATNLLDEEYLDAAAVPRTSGETIPAAGRVLRLGVRVRP